MLDDIKKFVKSHKIVSAIILIIVLLTIIVNIGNTKENVVLEEYDVKGLTIKEACEKVKNAGWTVDRVVSQEGDDKTDCYVGSDYMGTVDGQPVDNSADSSSEKSSEEQSNPSPSSSTTYNWKQFNSDGSCANDARLCVSIDESYGYASYGYGNVKGRVYNNSGENAKYMQISFSIYNASGAKIGDCFDNTSGLNAGTTWSYDAYCTGWSSGGTNSEIIAGKQTGDYCLSAQDAWNHIGEMRCVVFHYEYLACSNGYCFLDEKKNYTSGFVAFFGKYNMYNWDTFSAEYQNGVSNILVCGQIYTYQGHPEIKVIDVNKQVIKNPTMKDGAYPYSCK